MGIPLYVGNLPFETTDAELLELFQPHGAVVGAHVVLDRFRGKSRGFGFVEMADLAGARAAFEALNGRPHGGRILTVDEARPRAEGPRFTAGEDADADDPGPNEGRPD